MRSPPIIRLTVAYGAGLWVGLVVLVPSRGITVVLLLVALALAAGSRYLVAALILGVGMGTAAASARAGTCAARWEAGPRSAIVALHDRPGRRGMTTGTVLHTPERCGGTITLRFDSTATVPGGSRVVVTGVFRPPSVLRVASARTLASRRSWRFALRDAVGERVDRLYGPRAPLVEALVTGRREDLDVTLRQDFAASGLAHLLSISGLHVGIMAAWLVMILKPFIRRPAVLVISTTVSWAYVILLGCPAPATRTAGFITVHALSRWRQRHPSGDVILAVAVLLVVAIDPWAVTSVGAWLSATAVWGTGAATEALPAAHRGTAWKQLTAASIGATVMTAPITAFTFGAVAPIGILANLVAVPVAGLAVPAVFLSLFVPWMAPGAGLALAATERTAAWAAAVPGGHLSGGPGIGFALPWIALLAALLWARFRRPAWVLARRRLLISAVAWIWLGAVATSLSTGRRAPVEIHVLDVGQGDAIAVRSPRGRWILVDAGPRTPTRDAGRAVVLPFFRRQGVERLDMLVATHGDADHLGGVPAVIEGLDPGLLLESGQATGTALFLEHLAAIDAGGIPWRAARRGDTLLVDSMALVVLHPSAAWLDARSETNENSVVIRLTYGSFDALLTGDIGFPAESALVGGIGPVEVLKVGHHGSAGSTSDEWLGQLQPTAAVISVGRDNRYGHPAPATLGRLERAGSDVWRTDRGGTVTIGTDGHSFWIEQQRPITLAERIRCLPAIWSPSSDSFSSRRGCTQEPGRRVSYPTFSTTSRSPAR